jgi:hypothetical protein
LPDEGEEFLGGSRRDIPAPLQRIGKKHKGTNIHVMYTTWQVGFLNRTTPNAHAGIPPMIMIRMITNMHLL